MQSSGSDFFHKFFFKCSLFWGKLIVASARFNSAMVSFVFVSLDQSDNLSAFLFSTIKCGPYLGRKYHIHFWWSQLKSSIFFYLLHFKTNYIFQHYTNPNMNFLAVLFVALVALGAVVSNVMADGYGHKPLEIKHSWKKHSYGHGYGKGKGYGHGKKTISAYETWYVTCEQCVPIGLILIGFLGKGKGHY